MADNERQADDLKHPRRPDILRARDIIPGADSPAGKNEGVSNTDIPQFNLADDIMSEHRRLIAGRRKGPPGSPTSVPPPAPRPSAPLPARKPFMSIYGFSNGFNTASDPVIADIVARDIERLCRGLGA
jgi:hypothetical protein